MHFEVHLRNLNHCFKFEFLPLIIIFNKDLDSSVGSCPRALSINGNLFPVFIESLRRCLEQGIRTVFKSETTLRSHLVRHKDTVYPVKQDGVVYRIPCECRKVGETGRSMHERIKDHDRDIRPARTQTSAVSEHAHKTGHYPLWNEVKFIDRDPHWYTRRVKEAIHIRLHPDNINRDSGIEIPEAWMPTIKKHNRKTVQQRTTEGTTSRQNSEDRNAPITAHQRDINGTS